MAGYDDGAADTGCDSSAFFIRLRGLPWNINEGDIRDFLQGVQVDHVHIGINAMTKRQTGEAYLRLPTLDDQIKALDLNKATIGHRYIEVFTTNEDQYEGAVNNGEGDDDGGPVLKLRGLPWAVSKEDIRRFFVGLTIKNGLDGILLLQDQLGRASGEAIVEFATDSDAAQAMNKQKEKIGTRYIELFRSSIREMKWAEKRANRPAPRGGNSDGGNDFGGNGNMNRGGGGGGGGGGGASSRFPPGQGYGRGAGGNSFSDNSFGSNNSYNNRNDNSFGSGTMSGLGGGGGNSFGSSSNGSKLGGSGMGGGNMYSSERGGGTNYGSGRSNTGSGAGNYSTGGFGNTSYGGSSYGSGNGGGGGGGFNSDRGYRSQVGGNNYSSFGSSGNSFGSNNGGGGGGFSSNDFFNSAEQDLFCVHLRGMPFSCDDQDIQDFFMPLIPVKSNIEYDSRGRPSGEGNAFFETMEEAMKAMKKHKEKMGSRYIELFAGARKPQGNKFMN